MKRVCWYAPCHGVAGVWHALELDLISCLSTEWRRRGQDAMCRPHAQSRVCQSKSYSSGYQMLWETACVELPYVLPKKAIWRGCGDTGLGKRINLHRKLTLGPSQGSRGHCGLSGALSWQAPALFNASNPSSRHFSVVAWVVGRAEPGDRGVGMGGIHQAALFLHHLLYLRCPLLKMPFTFCKVPATTIEFKDPML